MKKVIALVLCVAVLLTLSVSAFAAEKSASSEVKHTVVMRRGVGVSGISANDSNTTVTEGDTIIAKPDPSEGTFDSWSVYKGDGTPAVEGVDYILTGGTSLSDSEVKIIAKSDIILAANYNGKTTDPGKIKKESGSPKTADMSVVFVVVMLASAAVAFGAKKVYSK